MNIFIAIGLIVCIYIGIQDGIRRNKYHQYYNTDLQ